MALITCKHCGQAVSDRAKKCPSCGMELLQTERQITCLDCGNDFSAELSACPKCGCPVENAIGETSQIITSAKTGKGRIHKKIVMIGAVVFAVVVIGIVIAVMIRNSSNDSMHKGSKEKNHTGSSYTTVKQEKQHSYPDLFDYGFLDDSDSLEEYGIEADIMGLTYRLSDSAEMFTEYVEAWRDNGYYVRSKDPDYEGNRVSWVIWVFSDAEMNDPVALIIYGADKDVGFATVTVGYL